MYCEVPRFFRCCFCVPLRYGILTFAYLNLLVSILVIAYLSYIFQTSYDYYYRHETVLVHGIVLISSHVAIPLTLYCLELIFNMVLIIGSHKKNTTWLKVFYYYGLTSTVATFVMFCIEIYQVEQFRYGDLYTISVMISLAFAGFALQGYIIMLVKNEIMKLENNQQFHFINHTAEAIVETSPTDAIYRNTTVEMI